MKSLELDNLYLNINRIIELCDANQEVPPLLYRFNFNTALDGLEQSILSAETPAMRQVHAHWYYEHLMAIHVELTSHTGHCRHFKRNDDAPCARMARMLDGYTRKAILLIGRLDAMFEMVSDEEIADFISANRFKIHYFRGLLTRIFDRCTADGIMKPLEDLPHFMAPQKTDLSYCTFLLSKIEERFRFDRKLPMIKALEFLIEVNTASEETLNFLLEYPDRQLVFLTD